LQAVEEVLDAYDRGADVVFLDAPTGAGKTLIGEMVRRRLGGKALYVCHSLGLQDQFEHDFPYAEVLKGRANYPTQIAPFPEVTCADCTLTTAPEAEDAWCAWCSEPAMCSYVEVRGKALEGALAVTNTAYLLAEANNVGRLLKDRSLVIADEADTLEQILMGTAEFRIGPGVMRRAKVEMPKKGSHGTTIGKWMVDELRPGLKMLYAKIGGSEDVEKIRERKKIARLIGRVEEVAREIQGDGWVRDYDRTDSLILKPVKVDTVGQDWVWKHAERWLLMSATLVSTDEMVESLGMAGMKVETVTVPMTFPVENRRIHAVPVATMTAKEKETAWPKMAEAVKGIQQLHPDEKILVHTVSYDLAKYLAREARAGGRQVYTYSSSQFRDHEVEAFKKETRPAIMFAPSLDRGFDFKGDEARVVIVAKVPYLYLGDQQVSARLRTRGGQHWYNVSTIRTLVQMTGRGVRSADDHCVTYILDGSFYKLYKDCKSMLPAWWRDALDTRTTRRDLGL
jgi:Rad3-related DNA helicase